MFTYNELIRLTNRYTPPVDPEAYFRENGLLDDSVMGPMRHNFWLLPSEYVSEDQNDFPPEVHFWLESPPPPYVPRHQNESPESPPPPYEPSPPPPPYEPSPPPPPYELSPPPPPYELSPPPPPYEPSPPPPPHESSPPVTWYRLPESPPTQLPEEVPEEQKDVETIIIDDEDDPQPPRPSVIRWASKDIIFL